MKKHLLVASILLSVATAFSQTDEIDHWETVYYWNSPVKYYAESPAPPIDWNTQEFDDNSWDDFVNIFGYGTFMDDEGIAGQLGLSELTTFYTRTKFEIADTSEVLKLMFSIHYEDAYVAYINGVEVARANIGNKGEATSHNQYADSTHQYIFYADILPEFNVGVYIDKDDITNVIREGENVLAIEVHNDEYKPESHHYFTALSAGIKSSAIQFQQSVDDEFNQVYNILPFPAILDSTNLPIVEISYPDSTYIPDEPKGMAMMKVIDNGSMYNKLSDTSYNYNGYIGIELRGSSSLNFYPKKSYSIETRDSMGDNNNVELLGLPRENDWVLQAPYGDKTLIRNVLTYKLSGDLGNYSPRTKFVDLVKNKEYRGTYVLIEKIKRDNDRIDIAGLRSDELAGDSLTGGYIIKIDKREGEYRGWQSDFGSAQSENYKVFYTYVYPKGDEIMPEQETYIQNYIRDLNLMFRSDNFDDPVDGYRKYIDVESFIDYLIINELSKNIDGYRLSTYMYKDRDDNDGLLYMGPVWDYNLAYGNAPYCNAYSTEGWSFDFGNVCPQDQYQLPFWWDRLLQDESFALELQQRWETLRQTSLSLNSIYADIDSLTTLTESSRERNFEVWKGVFTTQIWPNNPQASNYDGEVSNLKNWLSERVDWIDNNIGETRDKKQYVSIHSPIANEYIGIGAYPNPFGNEIQFAIDLEGEHQVQLSIYNISGQLVHEIVNKQFGYGSHALSWYGEGVDGSIVPTGIYLYQLVVDGQLVKSDKLVKY